MTRINERSDATARRRDVDGQSGHGAFDFHLVEECDFKRAGERGGEGTMEFSETDGKGNACF